MTRRVSALPGLTVLKLGGELLEEPARLAGLATAIVRMHARGPLVVVHGGGREIDAEAARQGIEKRSVEGLRLTDAGTLRVVVAVLAGVVNTRFVAAVVTAGGRAVGLTGADAGLGLAEPAPPHRTVEGRLVELGLVGQPIDADPPALLIELCQGGYLPILASLGLTREGQLLNVNADTFAAHLAATLGADRLLIAGSTAGVLDANGRRIERLDPVAIERLIAGGGAQAGMVAKLVACQHALDAGVGDIVILDGRDAARLETPIGTVVGPAERVTP